MSGLRPLDVVTPADALLLPTQVIDSVLQACDPLTGLGFQSEGGVHEQALVVKQQRLGLWATVRRSRQLGKGFLVVLSLKRLMVRHLILINYSTTNHFLGRSSNSFSSLLRF